MKDSWRDREKEEEEKEARKAERKAREKEASYQERLRKWESREAKQAKEHEKDKTKEIKKLEDQEREAKKLRQFLEDYEDDRDDSKYYKNRELERRLFDREREAQKDAEDRNREKEEIEELKAQIAKEGFDDPGAELQRRMMIEEAKKNSMMLGMPFAPVPNPHVMDMNGAQMMNLIPPHHQQQMGEQMDDIAVIEPDSIAAQDDDDIADHGHISPDDLHREDDDNIMAGAEDTDGPPPFAPISVPPVAVVRAASREASSSMEREPIPEPQQPTGPAGATDKPQVLMKQQIHVSGRKKLDVRDVFNQDDDDNAPAPKKRKLPQDGQHSSSGRSHGSSHDKKSSSKSAASSEAKSSEEKRRHIKSLIEKIPTDKNALFEYKVDWDMVDNTLMEKRIRPWVNKKINEYIGEPEPTLTDFICSKVLAGSSPKAVLEDVQMVLDEEAEVFVVKMWRLLIYEILNKRHRQSSSSGAEAR